MFILVVNLVPGKSYAINEMSDDEIGELRNILDGMLLQADEEDTGENETESEEDGDEDSASSSNGY